MCRERHTDTNAIQQNPGKHREAVGGVEEYKNFQIKCPYSECTEHGSSSLMGHHVQCCQYKPVLTTDCKHCGITKKNSEMEEHVKSECTKLPCLTCDRKIHANDYISHLAIHTDEQAVIDNARNILQRVQDDRKLRGRSAEFLISAAMREINPLVGNDIAGNLGNGGNNTYSI